MNLKRITIIIILIIAVLLGVYLFVPINNSKGEDISYKPNNKIEATDNKETIQTIEFLKSISGLKAKNIELIELDCEENQFTQEAVNALLTSLPMGKYNNGESISTLKINDKWDTSIAEEKGWKVN